MRRNSNDNDDDRPSLFGDDFALDAPMSKRNGPQPVSMLAGLGSRRPQPSAGRRPFWWAAAGLLLAVALAMAVYLQSVIGLAVNPFRAAVPDAPERTLARPPAVKTAALAPVAAAPAVAPAPLAARLEALPPAALVQLAPPVAKPASAVAVSPPQLPVVPPVVSPVSSAKPAVDAAPASAGAASAGSTLRVARAAPAQSAAKPAGPARPVGADPVGNDADVDLLAALMSHPNLVARAAAASAPRVPATLAGATSAVSTGAAANAAPAPADAKPRVEFSIATLVRDCTARADKQEALACRRRICEGYWGKAQACPRELQGPPGQSSGPVVPTAGKDKT